MPPCPIHSQFRVVGHDLGGTTHRTCPLSDFEPRSTWLKGATWEIPDKWEGQDAKVLVIQAEAQSKAREILVSQDTEVTGELDITNNVNQRILFQEQKRQYNIETVVRKAASHLGDKSVENNEPDHDWTARFFNDIQDVSSGEMQNLWAKVLAGEVERAGSTSIRTLGVLKLKIIQFTLIYPSLFKENIGF